MNPMLITWFETLMLAVLTVLIPVLTGYPQPVWAVSPQRAFVARRRPIPGVDRLWLTSAGGSGPGRQPYAGGQAAGCVLL